jgi:molybdopterin-guanine dinucleotide biosynthesis protein B
MKVFGIVGWSGSGKTTLAVRLVPELTGRGLTVSTIKHARHGFDIDKPGKDSYMHRHAGAKEVVVCSTRRWALIHENRGKPEPELDELIGRMTPVDLLLVEGFKAFDHDKLEVWRPGRGGDFLHIRDKRIIAVASDAPLPEVRLPVLNLDDAAAIADFIMGHCRLEAA